MFFQVTAKQRNTAKRAAFTAASPPVRISGVWRIASNPATPYSSLGFLIFTFRKASFFHQTCCPTSRQAVSPRCPPEVASCSHTRAPRAPAPPRLWLLPGTRRPPAAAACVPSASPPRPAAQPQVPPLRLCQESPLQQTPSPGGPRGPGSGPWGVPQGEARTGLTAKRVTWEEKQKAGGLVLKDEGDGMS